MANTNERVRTLVECIEENATFGGRRVSLLEVLALPVETAFPSRELCVPWEQNRGIVRCVAQVCVKSSLESLTGVDPRKATLIFDTLETWGLTPLPQRFEPRVTQIAVAMCGLSGNLRERVAEAYRTAAPRDPADHAQLKHEALLFNAYANNETDALRAIAASAAVNRRIS